MVQTSHSRLIASLPAVIGGGAGLLVGVVAAVLPVTMLEALVESSGLASVLPVAAPPLGVTARAVLALGGGVGVAAVLWAALYLLVGPGGPLAVKSGVAGVPSVRRADAHPDAPPRWPLSLGAPPPAPLPVEQDMPSDLDTPLAAFDPAALPPVPMEPVRALKPLAPAVPLQPGERLETFTLSPPPPVSAARKDEAPSIDALLRRLEQGARRRAMVAG